MTSWDEIRKDDWVTVLWKNQIIGFRVAAYYKGIPGVVMLQDERCGSYFSNSCELISVEQHA